MNNPSSLDLSRDWMPLDSKSPPTLLVYGDELAKQVLKADTIASYNLVTYWKLVARMGDERLPAIEELFDATPMFLHGQDHTDSRKRLMPLYKESEAALDSWLPGFCEEFFADIKATNERNPINAISAFLEQLARNIFANNLGCKANEIPNLPKSIFRMLARKQSLTEYDQFLGRLVQNAQGILQKSGRSAEDAWLLASISVMGREPLTGTLMYGLVNDAPTKAGWDAETLLHMAAPVNILGRAVIEDTTVRDLQVFKGQLIHICPFLLHMRNDYLRADDSVTTNSREQTSFTFGFGSHVCPGRKMSLKIVREFLKQLALQPPDLFDTGGLKLVRDFTLIPVGTAQ
jgi:cytochrome P450